MLPEPVVEQLAMRLTERCLDRFLSDFIPQLLQEPNLLVWRKFAETVCDDLSTHHILFYSPTIPRLLSGRT
jgi:hypothetical protein